VGFRFRGIAGSSQELCQPCSMLGCSAAGTRSSSFRRLSRRRWRLPSCGPSWLSEAEALKAVSPIGLRAAAPADVTLGAPVNGVVELAGPERLSLDEFARRYLAAT
jgi:hypothetical protein